ncbi:MAG: hypothetical protein ABI986_02050 [Chloroflexota bacterium]
MISNIFSVIIDQWRAVFGILFLMALAQMLTVSALRSIFDKRLTPTEYLTLGIAGWLLPASLISILWFLFGFKLSLPFNLLLSISLLILLIIFHLRFKPDPGPDSKLTTISLLLFLSASIFLRLAFVTKAVLPSYFDSAPHYLLIKNILGNNLKGLLASLTTNYYHLGYHILAAFITSTTQAEITKVMLILGQMILAIIPLSLFFVIKHETKSNIAGMFTVIVAAYGWYMPAHAVDWGKYPALTSLGLIPFVLSLAYLFSQYKSVLSTQKRWGLLIFLGVAILISGFMHSRSLVVFGIVFVAWIITTWQQKLPSLQQAWMFFAIIVAIIGEVIYIQKQDVLLLLLDPYIHKGIWITALVLLLSVFAQRSYPQLVLIGLLTFGFLLGSLFIPVQGLIPGHANLTLLDRPFVEMILFMPLSLLGGLGLAGLDGILQEKNIRLISNKGFIGLIVITLVLINAYFTYDLYPAKCCVFAGNDDVTAIGWINNQLPTDARIGVSATELKVLPSGVFEGYVGGDAGTWITPLTNRGTIPLLYNSSFDEQATLDNLCQKKITHLYVGELGQTFDDSQLSAQPAWYKVLLSMPQVRVYQVIGCK